MTRIQADPAALGAAAAALREATAVAREVHRGAGCLSDAATATGQQPLTAALGAFRSTWAYGLGLVVDDATTLARMLQQGAEVYAASEAAIAAACRP